MVDSHSVFVLGNDADAVQRNTHRGEESVDTDSVRDPRSFGVEIPEDVGMPRHKDRHSGRHFWETFSNRCVPLIRRVRDHHKGVLWDQHLRAHRRRPRMENLWVKRMGRVEDAVACDARIEERLLPRPRHRDRPLATWSIKEGDHLVGWEWTVVDRSPGQKRDLVPLWSFIDPDIEEGYPDSVSVLTDMVRDLGGS